MKKVSIIVPVYNSERYISKLIDSVLSQTYSNFELILVDDGSPDNSGTICEDYASKNERIKVYHQENKGCCEARNAGLREVTGEYIMFADGDDWLEPDCIEYLVRLAEENECQMAMSDRVAHGMILEDCSNNVRLLTPEDATCFILYAKTPIGPWNKIYSAEVINSHNLSFSVPWFGEGLYFSAMNAQYSNGVAVGHKAVYHYRLNNSESGTSVRKVLHGINALWNIKNIAEKLEINTNKTENAVQWHIHRNCFNLLWFIIGAGEEKKYRKLYRDTRQKLLWLTPKVFFYSDVSIGQKGLILLTGLMPRTAAKLATWRRNRKFKKG